MELYSCLPMLTVFVQFFSLFFESFCPMSGILFDLYTNNRIIWWRLVFECLQDFLKTISKKLIFKIFCFQYLN